MDLASLPSPQWSAPLDGSPSWGAAVGQTPGHTAEVREKRAVGAEADLNSSRKELWFEPMFFSLQSQPVAPIPGPFPPLSPNSLISDQIKESKEETSRPPECSEWVFHTLKLRLTYMDMKESLFLWTCHVPEHLCSVCKLPLDLPTLPSPPGHLSHSPSILSQWRGMVWGRELGNGIRRPMH